MNLTEKEHAFLKLCLNYATPAAQKSDNYSNAGIAEACSLFPEHSDKKTRRQDKNSSSVKTCARHLFLTADDTPGVMVSTPRFLDYLQTQIGGRRGYGGPLGYPSGHWLKFTNATIPEKSAIASRLEYERQRCLGDTPDLPYL